MNNVAGHRPSRRALLRGIGGVTVGLPMLDLFERSAQAAPPTYAFFMVGGNGVMQCWPFSEPAEKLEAFWPSLGEQNGSPGDGPFKFALTQAQLAADRPNRTTGEFAPYWDKLLLVKGVDHPKLAGGCPHHAGNQMVLTSARVAMGGDFQNQLAQGESIDNRIARAFNAKGRGPLCLHVGEAKAGGTGYGYPSYVSHAGPASPNPVEPNPMNAYRRMMGTAALPADVAAQLTRGRKSVNDLVRAQLQRLLARPDLSKADRDRLDQHLTSIRDIEIKLTGGGVGQDSVAAMMAVDGHEHDNANHDKVLRLHMDLVAFAFASDYTRTATLKTGDINDRWRATVDGTVQPVFHMISHRVLSDGAAGAAIANAQQLHAKIDRQYALGFKYLLDKLAALDTPTGKLIDQGIYAWTNHIANGKYHSGRDLPWVIVGNARGALRTGQFVNVSGFRVSDGQRNVKSNKLLNTLLTAAGVRKPDGSPTDDFGDPSLDRGVLSDLLKA